MGCPFANVLGVPGEGVHSTRFAGMAFYDILATFVVAIITSNLVPIEYFKNVPYWKSLLYWFLLAEILHLLFGVQTGFLKMTGLSIWKC